MDENSLSMLTCYVKTMPFNDDRKLQQALHQTAEDFHVMKIIYRLP